MKILKSYLKSVKLYLPKEQRNDIISELYENIFSHMKERETELGRPLTEIEQINILKDYGEPINVARSYTPGTMSLSFGKQLIGPELFPRYILLLLFNLLITSLITITVVLLGLPLNIPMMLLSLLIQFVSISLVFVLLEMVKRKYPESWLFPPASVATLFPVPRWQMFSGIIVWSIFTLYWILMPLFPVIFFGSAAPMLKFTQGWYSFYLPIALLLIMGILQRLINFYFPQRSLLLPVARIFINFFGLVIQYLMIKSFPFVTIVDNYKDNSHFEKLVSLFNGIIFGGVLSWLWIYMLISFVAYAWVIYCHVRRKIIFSSKGVSLSIL